jgi:hypothetical protein
VITVSKQNAYNVINHGIKKNVRFVDTNRLRQILTQLNMLILIQETQSHQGYGVEEMKSFPFGNHHGSLLDRFEGIGKDRNMNFNKFEMPNYLVSIITNTENLLQNPNKKNVKICNFISMIFIYNLF